MWEPSLGERGCRSGLCDLAPEGPLSCPPSPALPPLTLVFCPEQPPLPDLASGSLESLGRPAPCDRPAAHRGLQPALSLPSGSPLPTCPRPLSHASSCLSAGSPHLSASCSPSPARSPLPHGSQCVWHPPLVGDWPAGPLALASCGWGVSATHLLGVPELPKCSQGLLGPSRRC